MIKKLVDTGAVVFNSPEFHAVLTDELRHILPSYLAQIDGAQSVAVTVLRPGVLEIEGIDVDQTGAKFGDALKRDILAKVAEAYKEAYVLAKNELAFRLGIKKSDVSQEWQL